MSIYIFSISQFVPDLGPIIPNDDGYIVAGTIEEETTAQANGFFTFKQMWTREQLNYIYTSILVPT